MEEIWGIRSSVIMAESMYRAMWLSLGQAGVTFFLPGWQGRRTAMMLEDLASKNGTFLNGTRRLKTPVYLQDGDVIQIALVQNLVFLSYGSQNNADEFDSPISWGGACY
jgi:hypothetical protein